MAAHNATLLGDEHDDRLHLGGEMATVASASTLDWPAALFANSAVEVGQEETQGGSARPMFVEMAMMAGRHAPKGRDLLGALLGSACCIMDQGCEALRPLWAEEAMHRAYNFLRLVEYRNEANRLTEAPTMNGQAEEALVRDLVVLFRELQFRPDREVVP